MTPRDRLLTAAIDHVAAHGVGDLSLRQLAAALGTSHRMLIYHFGSKEGLLVAVVREVERRQRAAADDLDTSLSPGDALRQQWRRLSDPSLWPHERLFFEVYGQALQQRPGTEALLDGIVESWVAPAAEAAERLGIPRDVGRAFARMSVAVIRGLLLDLLATGEREEVDRAMELFVTAQEALLRSGMLEGVPEV